MNSPKAWTGSDRLGGLRRFAIAITVLNVLGHTWFGFEQAWIVPFVAVGTAYAMELLLEIIEAGVTCRAPRFSGGMRPLADFLLSAHISGLAVGMLLYTNQRLWPVALAAAVAVGSKTILRVVIKGVPRHFMNPSNFGISVTLLLFPWVSIAPPYQFTENLGQVGDWLLPSIVIVSGSFLNWRFTRRLPLVAAWLTGFAAQAALRAAIADAAFLDVLRSSLVPMSGLAFVLYTFYMVTDPATTPEQPRDQVLFGFSVAAMYGVLMSLHVVFGLFFALSLTSAGRVMARLVFGWIRRRARQPADADTPAFQRT